MGEMPRSMQPSWDGADVIALVHDRRLDREAALARAALARSGRAPLIASREGYRVSARGL